MRQLLDEDTRDRLISAAGVAIIHGLLGYALITGLGVHPSRLIDDALTVINLPRPSPPVPVQETAAAAQRQPNPEGAAAPPNITSRATPIVAPEPEVSLPLSTPVIAAPVPADGAQASSGAALLPGIGTGAGGIGIGTGSGNAGTGTGGGGAGVRARFLRGALSRADYPKAARQAGIGGRVQVSLTVGTDGRVTNCAILTSSGNNDLDETSCRLIRLRYRFEPARDARGRAVPDHIRESHIWWTRRPRILTGSEMPPL